MPKPTEKFKQFAHNYAFEIATIIVLCIVFALVIGSCACMSIEGNPISANEAGNVDAVVYFPDGTSQEYDNVSSIKFWSDNHVEIVDSDAVRHDIYLGGGTIETVSK